MKLIIKIFKSPDILDNLLSLFRGILNGFKLLISAKVEYCNKGNIKIKKRLAFGFLTNRIGLNPAAKGVLTIYKDGQLIIDGSVRIARDCKIYVPGELYIGDGTYINPNTMIFARTKVCIGANCAISWNCEIIDDDFHKIINPESQSKLSALPIIIGNNVWIGSGVKILKGVKIGNNAIVAAGSVVTKSVERDTLVAGIPAKLVREITRWE